MLNRIGHACISLLQYNTSVFIHFIKNVGYSAILCLVQLLNVTQTVNIFLAHFRFFLSY